MHNKIHKLLIHYFTSFIKDVSIYFLHYSATHTSVFPSSDNFCAKTHFGSQFFNRIRRDTAVWPILAFTNAINALLLN